jgi:hypothetical protein
MIAPIEHSIPTSTLTIMRRMSDPSIFLQMLFKSALYVDKDVCLRAARVTSGMQFTGLFV